MLEVSSLARRGMLMTVDVKKHCPFTYWQSGP